MIIIDKNAKREVQVKYPDRTRVLFPNLDDGYISSNDIVVPGINAPISDDGVSVATINDGAEGDAISKLVIGIEPVQSGTGYPSPDNVRPISGWAQAKVTRTGKNLLDKDSTDKIDAYIDTEGVIHTNNNQWTTTGLIKVDPSKKYVLSGLTAHPNTGVDNYRIFNSSGSYLGVIIKTATQYPIEFASNVEFIQFCYKNTDKDTVMLEVGSTATTYAPYNGQTYTIDLDGTRYGGTLNVGTGVLTVDKGFHTFNGTEAWEDYSSFSGFVTREINGLMKSGIRQDGWSNMLKVSKDSTAGQTNAMWLGVNSALFFAIGVYESMGNTVDAFKTYLSEHNLELVYPLANPFTVQLTAQEITTLLGHNNIWADCGDVLELSYSANMNIRLQDLLNEKLDKPTIPGTLGQVLTSDGEGGQTWETPE